MTTHTFPQGLLLHDNPRLGTGSNHTERLLSFLGCTCFTTSDAAGESNLEELLEEDVWAAHDKDFAEERKKKKDLMQAESKSEGSGISGGLSVAFADPASRTSGISAMIPWKTSCVYHQSAPVTVPDWSKIPGVNHNNNNNSIFIVDDDDVEEEEKLPPHEYLAREYLAATSVVEGVQGRTLKGRDMSRVRNAVWTHTGFLG